MPNFYSQNGEDFILYQIFKNKSDGFYVEVGCIDGRRFSNTLIFEQLGWKGICIEAHKDYIPLLQKNRPKSAIVHCAVGNTDEAEVPFYANSRGSLSTLDKSKEQFFRENYKGFFTGFELQTVRKCTLNSILKRHLATDIDILSIDIEGCEVEALKGLDLQIFRPSVLVVESDSVAHEQQLDNIIIPKGYIKSIHVEGNIFYLENRLLEQNIRNKFFEFEVIHTKHPLDKNGDKITKRTIDTRTQKRQTAMQVLGKIKNMLLRLSKKSSSTKQQATPEWGQMAIRNRFKDIASIIHNPTPVIIDAGAHSGETISIFLSYFPGAHIFAFEPNPDLFDELQSKFKNNNKITLHRKALGKEIKTLPFKILRNTAASSFMEPTKYLFKYHGNKMDVLETIDVEQVPLATLSYELDIDILKLDLQGYELEALMGCGNLLEKTKLIITEIKFLPLYKDQPLFSDIDLYLRINGFRILNLYDLWTQKDGQLTAGDAIYLNEKYFPV